MNLKSVNSLKTLVDFISSIFRNSIKNRLIALMLATSCLPILFVLVSTFNNSINAMDEEIINSNTSEVLLIDKYINKEIEQLDNMLFSFIIDPQLSQNMSNIDSDNIVIQFEAQKYISGKLSSTFFSNKYFKEIIFYIKNKKKLFYMDTTGEKIFSNYDMTKFDWFKTIDAQKDFSVIKGNEIKAEIMGKIKGSSTSDSFYLIRTLKKFEDRSTSSVIMINIRLSIFNDILEESSSNKGVAAFVFSEKGELIYNPYNRDLSKYDQDSLFRLLSDDKNKNNYIRTNTDYIFYNKVEPGHMTFVKLIPLEAVRGTSIKVLTESIIIGIIFMAISVILSEAIVLKTTRPIIQLANAMKNVQQNKLDIDIPYCGKDEVGVLQQSFVFMIDEIKKLIKKEYKSKIEMKTAQLKALQAQINPHFLNNTLQIIGGLAISKNDMDVYDAITAISDMFRYLIRVKSDTVTVNQELQHVTNYLMIQKLKYKEGIKTEISVNAEVTNCLIPKLCLQPIVENAFIHGFKGRAEIWELRIMVDRNNGLDGLEILIEDNGVGINEDKLAEINHKMAGNMNDIFSDDESMGLTNIDARIKLNFGNSYGIFISKRKEKGTRVSIHLPATFAKEETECSI